MGESAEMKYFRIPPVVRISLGLVLFLLSLLLVVETMGILPDPQKATLDLRKKTCESLAIYASLAVQKGELDQIQTTMSALAQRNEDILSAALRTTTGKILADVGNHVKNWDSPDDATSTPTNVQVPIFKNEVRWGTFEVSFKPAHANLFWSLWERPAVKLIVIVIPFSFLGFYVLMKKTLRHLDPSAVVPERVKTALDSLVEGVVLMDHRERVVLTNKAFDHYVGRPNESLLGKKVSNLKWTSPRSKKEIKHFPWQQAMSEGKSQAAVPLRLQSGTNPACTFMVNGAPILDGDGQMRGALATFDDVSQIEAQNTRLQKILKALKKSRDKIHRQNRELQILATQDPLTGCLNRRAFFERFEMEFNRARRYGHDFSCVMVDIDHFKSINDNHGHPVGDKVLQKVSGILRASLRDSDAVCRYGGEEFCLILPETGAPGALKTAERIRHTMAAEAILGIKVTISLGVSALDSDPENSSELLSQADKALYAAKTGGRNRVVGYNDAIIDSPQNDTAGEETRKAGGQESTQPIPHHVVKALMLALEHRDIPTAEHSRKVADLCVSAAQGLMSISECFVLETAGLLHDIGKLGVPDSILLKPGPLTKDEWLIMRDHERRSVDVIASTFLSPELVEIVRHHSKWYDGSSSDDPSQPKGKDIPLGARILNIADAFHAMVSHRPYRRACGYEEAFKELRRCAGSQFDPEMVEHFINVVQAKDESRRKEDSAVSNSVKLVIGREVEELLDAVNTFSIGELSLSAEHLASRAKQYGLTHIASTAAEIEKAVTKDNNQMEIVELTSKLLQLCGSPGDLHRQETGSQRKSLVA
jgi:diguanylate cyclase (GGDEF)-like protein/PAS domain S-box-containing protein